MSRTRTGTRGLGKKIIRVFCEGESEQAYIEFLKRKFENVAVINYSKELGLFDRAKSRFLKDPKYRDYTDIIDEIWFFFDVEEKDISKVEERFQIINFLRKLRKDSNITVRLLMTSGCVEYWYMLHYKYYVPSVQSIAEKDKVIAELKLIEPFYEKGNVNIAARIGERYPFAIKNAEKVMTRLLFEGMPGMEDTDERNKWLCRKCVTFSNVYEAIVFLENL